MQIELHDDGLAFLSHGLRLLTVRSPFVIIPKGRFTIKRVSYGWILEGEFDVRE